MRANMTAARKAKELTQAQLGALVGLTASAICDIEKGRSNGRTSTWQKLAALLKLPQEELQRQI